MGREGEMEGQMSCELDPLERGLLATEIGHRLWILLALSSSHNPVHRFHFICPGACWHC